MVTIERFGDQQSRVVFGLKCCEQSRAKGGFGHQVDFARLLASEQIE